MCSKWSSYEFKNFKPDHQFFIVEITDAKIWDHPGWDMRPNLALIRPIDLGCARGRGGGKIRVNAIQVSLASRVGNSSCSVTPSARINLIWATSAQLMLFWQPQCPYQVVLAPPVIVSSWPGTPSGRRKLVWHPQCAKQFSLDQVWRRWRTSTWACNLTFVHERPQKTTNCTIGKSTRITRN